MITITSLGTLNIPETSCLHSGGHSSVWNTIDSGFGPNNSLTFSLHSCKPNLNLTLNKENYLSEFSTEEEKAQVRLNLLVPSLSEITTVVKLALSNYATKQELDNIIAGSLDLTNYYSKKEVDAKLSGIKLNLDTTPTKSSTNAVTSGGVWLHIDDTVGSLHRYTKTI